MVDPFQVTKYDRTDEELEEFIIFSILMAGHDAKNTARGLERFLGAFKGVKPFEVIGRHIKAGTLSLALQNAGLGCHAIRAKSLQSLLESGLDLRRCSLNDLERINGIGPKTSRFFLLHSRANIKVAALDIHILRYLKAIGHKDIPSSTPTGKSYRRIERLFLEEADKSGMSVADFDLFLWRQAKDK